MWFFEYRIEYYDDGDYCQRKAMGVVVGKTINEAMEYLCGWYGESNINKLELEYIENAEAGVMETSNRKEKN